MSGKDPSKNHSETAQKMAQNGLVTVQMLSRLQSPYLAFIKGDSETSGSRPFPPRMSVKNSLVFVSELSQAKKALENGATIFICLEKISPAVAALLSTQALFSTPSIAAAMALILPFFEDKLTKFPRGIHPTAVIAPSAQVSAQAHIGAYAVIGELSFIGAEVFIGPHCVVEKSARVLEKTILHAHVYIGADCEVGQSCEIHPFTCVGSDGFGYVQGPDQRQHKIPQLGKVVLEDQVELGAHCAIDRGTLFETRIKKGAKLDNHCHIAHNCSVGENTVLAAGFMTAGSTHIGANCQAGGMVGVADHITIADGVSLGGRTGVTHNIETPGVYVGYPVMPLKEGLRNLSAFTGLHEIRKELSKIYKHLGLEKDPKKGSQ